MASNENQQGTATEYVTVTASGHRPVKREYQRGTDADGWETAHNYHCALSEAVDVMVEREATARGASRTTPEERATDPRHVRYEVRSYEVNGGRVSFQFARGGTTFLAEMWISVATTEEAQAMSYMWGITTERPTRAEARRRREAAKAEGATYVEVNVKAGECPGINGGRYQGWYVGPNYGAPFDARLAQRVDARLGIKGSDAGED